MTTYLASLGLSMECQTCASCGIIFAFSKEMTDMRRRDHQWFFCPNGHQMAYQGPSDIERAQAATKRAQQLLEMERGEKDRARLALASAEALLKSEKAATKRLKNRISKGVCPCCNRSFENLRRHMDSKHPTYSPAPEAP